MDYCKDLEILIQDLDSISEDITHYLHFLIERKCLMHQVLIEEPALNN